MKQESIDLRATRAVKLVELDMGQKGRPGRTPGGHLVATQQEVSHLSATLGSHCDSLRDADQAHR